MAHKITFIIAPAGCEFHHIGPICKAIGAKYWTEVSCTVKAQDMHKVLNVHPGHHAVFTNSSRGDLAAIYADAEIIGYYDACRAAGVSPFHTGNGQLIAPLNHAASLAAAAAEPLKPRETYGVLMEVATERAKQISKGFDASQDDRYTENELVKAANVYALNVTGDEAAIGWLPWPWDVEAFRPEGRRADLIKAAALLVAEIERMDRANAAPSYVLCEFCHGLDGDHKTGCCRVTG